MLGDGFARLRQISASRGAPGDSLVSWSPPRSQSSMMQSTQFTLHSRSQFPFSLAVTASRIACPLACVPERALAMVERTSLWQSPKSFSSVVSWSGTSMIRTCQQKKTKLSCVVTSKYGRRLPPAHNFPNCNRRSSGRDF
jgi:hypothetical protein